LVPCFFDLLISRRRQTCLTGHAIPNDRNAVYARPHPLCRPVPNPASAKHGSTGRRQPLPDRTSRSFSGAVQRGRRCPSSFSLPAATWLRPSCSCPSYLPTEFITQTPFISLISTQRMGSCPQLRQARTTRMTTLSHARLSAPPLRLCKASLTQQPRQLLFPRPHRPGWCRRL
jgi:hypothetical protein